jgi:mono/diheme cytochrome c family protein
MRRGTILLLLAPLFAVLPGSLSAADAGLSSYLETHCFSCHDSTTKKGGLDLETLPAQFDTRELFDKWARVHDRIAAGEMPPKSRRERPSEKENADVLRLLDAPLHAADAARIAKTGRALFRRLSAQEYENALSDLLHLPGLRIKAMLPEDERRHGYDKIGQALNLSNVHLNQFMDAADIALTAAIATRSTPPPLMRQRYGAATSSETWHWMEHGSAVTLKDKQYDPVVPMPGPEDDLNQNQELKKARYAAFDKLLRDYPHSAGFFTGATHRPMIFSLQFSPVYAGHYRIRTSAWGFWWDRGKVEPPKRNESFALTAWLPSEGPRFHHSPARWLGLFDVGSTDSRIHEYSGWFEVNDELVFDIGTLNGHEKTTGRFPGDAKGSCAVYTGPGIALDWFEVEGPIVDQWPPRSHCALFGDLPIRPLAHDSGVIPPKRTPVRQRSRSARARPANGSIPAKEQDPPLESVFSGQPQQDATRLLAQFLPRAFRRPVPAEEVQGYARVAARELERHASFEDAMKEAYKAALCSPDFLFVGVPSGAEAGDPHIRLTDRAIAERLALWFWNSLPDEELVALANEGRLHLYDNLKKQTDRLLADPRSDRFIANFADQWLDLRKIDATQPDLRLYPEARTHLIRSMIDETRAYLRELITQNLSVTHLVQSDFAMLNQSLAIHYGIAGVTGCAIRKVALPKDSPRGAFLTQAAVLKVTANGTDTSPVTRGAWINERILGNPIPPPPAGVPALDPDTRGATTIREKLEKHRSDTQCAGCHAKIDPPGFALESFDVIGGLRTRYRSLFTGSQMMDFHFPTGWDPRVRLNQPVDASGQLPGGESFQNLAGFQVLILRTPETLAANMVGQLLMYGTGSEPHYSDRREIKRILAQTKQADYGLRSLIDAIVHSELFLAK